MTRWLRGKTINLIAFTAIIALVVGALGWVTTAALKLEQEQWQAQGQAEEAENYRLALWRLDSFVSPMLAHENARPYQHYSAIFAPTEAFRGDGLPLLPGLVIEPSPFLSTELQPWILLHFQGVADKAWSSPQVLSPELTERLCAAKVDLTTLKKRSRSFLELLTRMMAPQAMLAHVHANRGATQLVTDTTLLLTGRNDPTAQANSNNFQNNSQDYFNRAQQQYRASQQLPQEQHRESQVDVAWALANATRNGEGWLFHNARSLPHSKRTTVRIGPLRPLWTKTAAEDWLILARRVDIGSVEVCQGILVDWPVLRKQLLGEIEDLFPEASLVPAPVTDETPLERTMTALPVLLEPGRTALISPPPAWSPLRIGLVLAWAAELMALAAVGLGGWMLLELSERRGRFVSAVTHELRTPLTTLRLYLDLLTGGVIQEERHKKEYLNTLAEETERLTRLVGNVLDFSRLENQRPRLEKVPVSIATLLEEIREMWISRCQTAGKDLVVQNQIGVETEVITDVGLLRQVLGNLIDNACKYSRDADDPRIWLRARAGRLGSILLEVEDRGPGIPPQERQLIFRAFRRGREADATTGGVGLGLALAQRWVALLGGRLRLEESEGGALFQIEIGH